MAQHHAHGAINQSWKITHVAALNLYQWSWTVSVLGPIMEAELRALLSLAGPAAVLASALHGWQLKRLPAWYSRVPNSLSPPRIQVAAALHTCGMPPEAHFKPNSARSVHCILAIHHCYVCITNGPGHSRTAAHTSPCQTWIRRHRVMVLAGHPSAYQANHWL